MAEVTIAQCYGKCKTFCTLRRMWVGLDGHLYCEDDKPEGAVHAKNVLFAQAYGITAEEFLKLVEK